MANKGKGKKSKAKDAGKQSAKNAKGKQPGKTKQTAAKQPKAKTRKQPARSAKAAQQPAAPKPAEKYGRVKGIADKPMTRAQVQTHLADHLVGMTEELGVEMTPAKAKKLVAGIFGELEVLIYRHIKKRAIGRFNFFGLMSIKSAKRPAQKKRMGRNPATGEEIEIPAKPASVRARVTPLKGLKEMIG